MGLAPNFPCNCVEGPDGKHPGWSVPVFMRGASYARGSAKDCNAPTDPDAETIELKLRPAMSEAGLESVCAGQDKFVSKEAQTLVMKVIAEVKGLQMGTARTCVRQKERGERGRKMRPSSPRPQHLLAPLPTCTVCPLGAHLLYP